MATKPKRIPRGAAHHRRQLFCVAGRLGADRALELAARKLWRLERRIERMRTIENGAVR